MAAPRLASSKAVQHLLVGQQRGFGLELPEVAKSSQSVPPVAAEEAVRRRLEAEMHLLAWAVGGR